MSNDDSYDVSKSDHNSEEEEIKSEDKKEAKNELSDSSDLSNESQHRTKK